MTAREFYLRHCELIDRLVLTVAILWLVAALGILTVWAVRTRLGWRSLRDRPPRHNFLQLPMLVLLFAAYVVIVQGVALGTAAVRAVAGGSQSAKIGAAAEPTRPAKDAAGGLAASPTDCDSANPACPQAASSGGSGRAASLPHRDPWILAGELVSQLLFALLMIAAARYVFAGGLRTFGLRRQRLGRDVLAGAGYTLVLFPVILLVLHLTTWLFRKLGIGIVEHVMLEALRGTSDLWVVLLGSLVAAIGAPLWEELFFRGILQSFLVRFFRVMMPPKGFPTMALWLKPPEFKQLEAEAAVARARAAGEQPPVELGAWPDAASAGGQAEPLSPPQEARRAIAAILVGAAVFAAVHLAVMPSSVPAIFVLALGLGYAYEKSGSLAVCLSMHVVFNALNLALAGLQQIVAPPPAAGLAGLAVLLPW